MLKRLFSAFLCILMVVPILSGCSSYDPDEDVGKTINLYLSEEVYDFDPAYAYNSTDALQLASLMFITLFSVDDDGKLQKELVDSYKITNNDDKGIYRITFTLKNTSWSDGTRVSANDVVFAWRRILNPNTVSDAAVLLYEIKNAKNAKNGNCSIDDVAIYAIDEKTLQVDFEGPIDFKTFLFNLASPCLAPLRETAVNDSVDWSKNVSSTVCSGPFTLRSVVFGESLTLERNSYYFRNRKKDSIKKYVTPYRLVVDYKMTKEEQLQAFEDGTLAYISDIALSRRGEYKDSAKISNALSTTSLIFNTSNAMLANPDVRLALSLAIERNAIADKLVFADAAKAFVPAGVFNATSSKNEFRDKGEDYISVTADLDQAKKLISEAGVSGATIHLTIRDTEENSAIADIIASNWKQLGITVEIVKLSKSENDDATKEGVVSDEFYDDEYRETAIIERSFDVLLTEINAVSTDAFSVLAPFADSYSGSNMIFNVDSYVDAINLAGYSSEEYNALIDAAFAEKDISKRSNILHEAEALLMKDLPIAPIVFNKTARLIADNLKSTSVDYFGITDFSEAKLK